MHVPYIKGATHHLLNATTLKLCKPNVHLLNFSRGEIIDGEAVRDLWASGALTGKYISDFADPFLQVRALRGGAVTGTSDVVLGRGDLWALRRADGQVHFRCRRPLPPGMLYSL